MANTKMIVAKYPSKCAQTGKAIKKGESMVYDYDNKLCYCSTSDKYKNFNNEPEQDDASWEAQACDNWASQNL